MLHLIDLLFFHEVLLQTEVIISALSLYLCELLILFLQLDHVNCYIWCSQNHKPPFLQLMLCWISNLLPHGQNVGRFVISQICHKLTESQNYCFDISKPCLVIDIKRILQDIKRIKKNNYKSCLQELTFQMNEKEKRLVKISTEKRVSNWLTILNEWIKALSILGKKQICIYTKMKKYKLCIKTDQIRAKIFKK